MGSFPLTIAGQVFSNTTLGGRRYVHNYPELLRKVVEHSKRGAAFEGSFEISRRWFPAVGEHLLRVPAGKLFFQGMFVQLENFNGNSFAFGIVDSYDRTTGDLLLNVQGYTGTFAKGIVLIKASGSHFMPVITGPLPVASGGTASSNILAVMSTFDYSHPYGQLEEIFDDFCGFVNPLGNAYSCPWRITDSSGTDLYDQWLGDLLNEHEAIPEFEDRSGFLDLVTLNPSDAVTLEYGNGGCHFGGGNLDYSTAVYIPTLSNGTNSFKVYFGLKGSNSTAANPFSYSGIGFTYTHNENSGQWVVRYGTAGTMLSAASGITVAAGTWYTLRLLWNGTNCVPSINGTNLTAIASGNVPQSGVLNTVTPVMRIQQSAGFGPCRAYVDYVFRQKKVSR